MPRRARKSQAKPASTCSYRDVLRGFIKYRQSTLKLGYISDCIMAKDIARHATSKCSVDDVRKHMAKAERQGLIHTRVMQTEHAKRHRRRRVPLKIKCYHKISFRRRRGY